jgi:predicted ATPase
METVSRYIVQHAQQLAREVAARAVLVYADALREHGELLQAMDFPTVFVTRSTEAGLSTSSLSHAWVHVTYNRRRNPPKRERNKQVRPMRITKLQLENYKCFQNITLDNLSDRVVLVGPNGSGKSAILEAIAVLKEFIGTYHPSANVYYRSLPPTNRNALAWPDGVPVPVRGNEATATVTAELELDETEKTMAGGLARGKVGIKIDRSGEVSVLQAELDLQKLFSHFDPGSGIGVIDYISPFRTFPQQRVSNINLNAVSVTQQRIERIELPRPNYDSYSKFRTVKDFIIGTDFEEYTHFRATGEQLGGMDVLRGIFSEFFSPKILVGCKKLDAEMQVAIRTPYGDHDIDQLSSGEKELFFIFVNLFCIRKLPSVILYDEPERHLNAGLETRIIPALNRLQTRNQLWIATHGVELIGSVPMQDIVALKKESSGVQFERFTEPSRTDRVRLLELLGAKVGLQLACNRVVFLEGKNSQADKRILDKLAGPKLPGVLFVASGPSVAVMGAGTRAGVLLEEASKGASFFMVLDRDFRDAASVAALEKKLNNRVYVWKCHEVENLLLSPEAIREVLTFSGVDSFKTTEEVRKGLREAAQSLHELFACQWAAYRMHSGGHGGDEEAVRPTDETNLRKLAANAGKRFGESFSEASVTRALEAARKDVLQCLGTDRWLRELPGKEILEEFRKKHLPGVQSDTFKEQIVSAMVRASTVPKGVDELCDFIKSR